MIPLYKIFMPADLLDNFSTILYSGMLSYGKYARQFEQKIGDYIENPYLLVTSNHHYSLQIAFNLIHLDPGDEVIASPMCCLGSTQPILTCGGKVIWADIDPSTGTLDPYDVKKRITKRTKAILHYHWCGYPGYIDEINKLADEFGIIVVEDAFQGFGSEYRSKKVGNNGSDITCFSFDTVRLPTSISGGAISFNSQELFDKAFLMRDHGINRKIFRDEQGEVSDKCNILMPGYDATINEVNGYVGSEAMNSFDKLLKQQKLNAEILSTGVDHSQRIKQRKNASPSYWVYTLLVNQRDNLLKYLRENDIYASKVHLRNDIYTCFNSKRCSLPGVDEFSNKHLSIPCGWWVSSEDCEYILSIIKQRLK